MLGFTPPSLRGAGTGGVPSGASSLLSQLPPDAVLLPTGWQLCAAPPLGALYFFDTSSGARVFDAATMAAAAGLPPEALLPDPRTPPLPEGWTARVSRSSGKPYAVPPGGGAAVYLLSPHGEWQLSAPEAEGGAQAEASVTAATAAAAGRWSQKTSRGGGVVYENVADGRTAATLPPGAAQVFSAPPPFLKEAVSAEALVRAAEGRARDAAAAAAAAAAARAREELRRAAPSRAVVAAAAEEERRLLLLERQRAAAWDVAQARLPSRLRGHGVARLCHGGRVSALAVDEGGGLISGGEERITLWAPGAGKLLRSIAGRAAHGLAALPGGRCFAACGPAELVGVWDAGTGRLARHMEGHAAPVRCVAALPRGGLLASAGDDAAVAVWDAATGALAASLEGHGGAVLALAALPDGSLASGGTDETVRVWDIRARACARVLQHPAAVRALAPLANGRLAAGCSDGSLHTWALAGGAREAALEGHAAPVDALAALPSGLLASGGADGVRLWNVGARACVAVLEVGVRALAALPDGRLATASLGDDVVRVWALTQPGTAEDAAAEALSRRGVEVAPIFALRAHCVRALAHFKARGGGGGGSVAVGDPQSDVSALAVVQGGRLVSGSAAGGALLWPPAGADIEPLSVTAGAPVFAASSLPSGLFATAGGDGFVSVWEAASGRRRHLLRGHAGRVLCLAAPPGGLLASGGYDNTVRLWSAASGDAVATLEGHAGEVRALAVLPSGHLASAGDDAFIRVWDTALGTSKSLPLPSGAAPVGALAALHGGRLACGCDDGSVRVWTAEGLGAQEALLEGHAGAVLALAPLPSGLLASGGADGTARVWDLGGARACVAVLKGHLGPVRALAALPDGCLACGAEGDPLLRVWALTALGTPEDAAAEAAARLCEERVVREADERLRAVLRAAALAKSRAELVANREKKLREVEHARFLRLSDAAAKEHAQLLATRATALEMKEKADALEGRVAGDDAQLVEAKRLAKEWEDKERAQEAALKTTREEKAAVESRLAQTEEAVKKEHEVQAAERALHEEKARAEELGRRKAARAVMRQQAKDAGEGSQLIASWKDFKAAEKEVERIREECRRKNERYRDGWSGPAKNNSKWGEVDWVDWRSCAPNPTVVVGGYHHDDIVQGKSGTCYFLSAISEVAGHDRAAANSLLDGIFVNTEVNDEGVYCVRLWVHGAWRHLFLDSTFPVLRNKCMEVNTADGSARESPVRFEGAISGTTLTVAKALDGLQREAKVVCAWPGWAISGPGVAPGTTITGCVSGEGLTGTYTVSISQEVPSTVISAAAGGRTERDGKPDPPRSFHHLASVRSCHVNEFWPCLLEKAWAMLHGSYQAVESSTGTTLEGAFAKEFPLNYFFPRSQGYYKAFTEWHGGNVEVQWGRLAAKMKRRPAPIITLYTAVGATKDGIVGGHVYALLKLVKPPSFQPDLRLAKVRNPWGSTEWSGPFSDADTKAWTREVSEHVFKRSYDPAAAKDDGVFYMPFGELVKRFVGVSIAPRNDGGDSDVGIGGGGGSGGGGGGGN